MYLLTCLCRIGRGFGNTHIILAVYRNGSSRSSSLVIILAVDACSFIMKPTFSTISPEVSASIPGFSAREKRMFLEFYRSFSFSVFRASASIP